MTEVVIETARLRSRHRHDEDVASVDVIGQGSEVIRFLYDDPPGINETGAKTDALREVRDRPEATPVANAVGIGWRIARSHWRQGFAREAARASLGWAWSDESGEVAAITVPANEPSRGLMKKLGMARDAQADFNHPALPTGHRLSHHLLCRIARPV